MDGALQSEGHDFELAQSARRDKGRLLFLFLIHKDLPVTRCEIGGTEKHGTGERVHGLVDTGIG